jgi:hypothetical protein
MGGFIIEVLYCKRVRQCTYKRKNEARSRNHSCRGKAIIITYSDYVSVVFITHYAKRILRIAICALSGSTIFSTLSHLRHNFRKKKLLNTMATEGGGLGGSNPLRNSELLTKLSRIANSVENTSQII